MENELVASNTTTNTKMKKNQKNTTTTTERHGHAMHQESQGEMLKNSEKLKKYIEKVHSRGIVYLSRLPPNMKPQKMRHLLEQYGEIGRVYLAAEDPLVRKKRKQMGGHQGKKYTEGWVEFESKKDAKMAAALLNGEPMGGKKRSSHYYDLWCIKYLPKFTWDNLTEELNYQRAVMDQKMAAEVAAAHRERDFYLSRVDKAKAVESIIERQHENTKGPRKVRTFQQKRAKSESCHSVDVSGVDVSAVDGAGGSVSSSLLKKLAGAGD